MAMNWITIAFEDAGTGLPTQILCGVDGDDHSLAMLDCETDIETFFESETARDLIAALAPGVSSALIEFSNRDDDPRGRFEIGRIGALTRLSVEVTGEGLGRSMEVVIEPDAVRRLRDALARQPGSG